MKLAVSCVTAAAVLLMLAASLVAAADQPRERVPRVGYLPPGSPSDAVRLRRFEAFRQGLRDLGYVEGQNVAIESLWAEGNYDRYPALAADLVRENTNVIVAVGRAATQAAQRATRTIPIAIRIDMRPPARTLTRQRAGFAGRSPAAFGALDDPGRGANAVPGR